MNGKGDASTTVRLLIEQIQLVWKRGRFPFLPNLINPPIAYALAQDRMMFAVSSTYQR